MSETLLLTKLYIPSPRLNLVLRPRLVEQLNKGLSSGHKLALISAPAGFGKTTLVSEWIAGCGKPIAWLSLDEGDNEPTHFLTYFIAALQTLALSEAEGISANIGAGILSVIQSPQPPPIESILIALLNEISTIPESFVFVLDDYHVIDSKPVDEAITFLIEHLPPQMHLVIATREDPPLPLARLRAKGHLTELRAANLRFNPSEAAEFLNQVMALNLSAEDIAALETRTEGWIAGLQLAAISMHGNQDNTCFIQSFTGSHHFVLDYLLEEVLQHQPESVQNFLLRTSILDRLCGSLCDAVLGDTPGSGQETLKYLEHANLFIVPLDNERIWYRYHHLFADLLRMRLRQNASSGNIEASVAEYHIRASQWYEDSGHYLEAFQYAAAANDVERATRLMEAKGMPLHFHFAVKTILNWLASLPSTVLDANPLLWVRYATMALVTGQTAGVEERLQAAEAAIAVSLQGGEPDLDSRNLIGQIAAARATLALLQHRIEDINPQSHRALEYLPPDNLTFRFTAIWALGVAYQVQGDRAAAERALTEALSISQMSGKKFHMTLVSNGLGHVQELENKLYRAAETYKRGLLVAGEYPHPTSTSQTYLGLARICYEWNDLDAAELHGQQSLNLIRQFDQVTVFVTCTVLLIRLKLARGDVVGAALGLAEAEQSMRQHNNAHRISEIAATKVLVLLRQGDLVAAANIAQTYSLPLSQARVFLAQGDAFAALSVLEPLRQQMKAKGWADELLKVMVLQSIALNANGEKDKAVQLLSDTLALAEPGGFVRIFVDEGEAMRLLLEKLAHNRDHPLISYLDKLLAAFTQPAAVPKSAHPGQTRAIIHQKSDMIESLSERELEVLKLLRSELSGPEIAQQLVVSLNTLRTHTKNIFNKLGVNNRRAAIRRAEEIDLF